jgi:hypothetical protein
MILVSNTTVTVPTYFDTYSCSSLHALGEVAGIEAASVSKECVESQAAATSKGCCLLPPPPPPTKAPSKMGKMMMMMMK